MLFSNLEFVLVPSVSMVRPGFSSDTGRLRALAKCLSKFGCFLCPGRGVGRRGSSLRSPQWARFARSFFLSSPRSRVFLLNSLLSPEVAYSGSDPPPLLSITPLGVTCRLHLRVWTSLYAEQLQTGLFATQRQFQSVYADALFLDVVRR